MIQRVHPLEAAVVSILESMLEYIKVVQKPHNLFREQNKRLRRISENLEDAIVEIFAAMAGCSEPSPWSEATAKKILAPLGPFAEDLNAIHDAIHAGDNNANVWSAWGPPSAEVSAFMAVETLVESLTAIGKLVAALGMASRASYGIPEEESRERTQKRPNIQIVGGSMDDLPGPLRDMLRRLTGDQG